MSRLSSILDVRVKCPRCGWVGIMSQTIEDADGQGAPGCPMPDCGELVTWHERRKKNRDITDEQFMRAR